MGIKKFKLLGFLLLLSVPILGQNGNEDSTKANVLKEYNIALVLPFNSEGVRGKLSEVILDYYVGFKLGVKHASIDGFRGNLYVFDHLKDSASFDHILNHSNLKKMDLIVGPVYDKALQRMSRYCDSSGQILVAPLRYFKNEYYSNPVINFFPSDEIQVQSVIDRVTEKYPNHTFYVAGDISNESQKLSRIMTTALRLKDVFLAKHKLILSNGVLNGDIQQNDSVIIISSSIREEMQIVMERTLKKKDFSAGIAHFNTHKKTKEFRLFEKIFFPDLYHYKRTDSSSKQFFRKFKINQLGSPSKYASIGYDQSIYLAYSLMTYGIDFSSLLPGGIYQGIRNRVHLKPDPNGNITNYGIFFYKHYSDYTELVE